MQASAVVIGGGISGLAAAMRLSERLDPAGVMVLESSDRLGGKIRTERRDGFILEDGPDCFLASKPAGVSLCRQLGLADRLIGTTPSVRRSYVKRGGRLYPLPEGITGLVPSRLMPLLATGLLSVPGRVRAGLEVLVPPRRADEEESVAEFARRRFGSEAYAWLIEPLLSGIFAGNGETLSLDSTFPQLRVTERRDGSLLRPLLTARLSRRRTRPTTAGFVTLRDGMGELVEALARRLEGTQVLTGAEALTITPSPAGSGYQVVLADGRVISTPAIVLATPAHQASRLVSELDDALARALTSIPSVSTATISLAFPAHQVPVPLSGYGYVSPRAEGGALVACTWTSNKFAGRAPAGTILVRCFVGRAGLDSMVADGDAALVALAREELARVHRIAAPPELVRVTRWHHGMPQYTLGHEGRLRTITDRLSQHAGLELAGASYRGVGIPDCIASGWAAAEALTQSVAVG